MLITDKYYILVFDRDYVGGIKKKSILRVLPGYQYMLFQRIRLVTYLSYCDIKNTVSPKWCKFSDIATVGVRFFWSTCMKATRRTAGTTQSKLSIHQ